MKTRDSSDSFDSEDIDLDEIAKMIDPLDDLENNLFSVKPSTITNPTVRISSPKKEPLRGDKLEERDNNEAEVLTSFSSDNGQGKSESLGKSLSKNLERDGVAGSGGQFNVSARARRRNSKFASGVEGITSGAADGEFLASSNLETGLWSGDDLWRLNEDKVLGPPESSKASVMAGSKSPHGDSKGQTATGQPVSMRTKVDNKPGKFDWLGLCDDESEGEKGISTGNKNQKPSTGISSIAPKEVYSLERLEKLDVNWSSVDQDHSRVRKGSLGVPKETKIRETISNDIEPKGKLNKSSLSENLSSKKGDLKSSESERLDSRKTEAKLTKPGVMTKVGDKAAKLSDVMRSDEDDHLNALGLSIEGGGGGKSKGAPGGGNEMKEEYSEAPVHPRRRSLMEDDERSARSYTPTFLGGSPEKPGRRRRKREGSEALPSRSAINPDFDPLGLFSVDDNSSKLEETSKSKTTLPDWLTGSSKKLSVVKEDDPHVSLSATSKEVGVHEGLKEEERPKEVESRRGSYGEKSREVASQLSKQPEKIVSEVMEKNQGVSDSSEFIKKDVPEKFHVSSRKDADVPPSPHASHSNESDKDSENLSGSMSDVIQTQSPVHAAKVVMNKKKSAPSSKISEVNELSSLKSKDKLSSKGKGGDGKPSKKQHMKTSSIKTRVKKRDMLRNKVGDEDADISSPSEMTDSRSDNMKQLGLLERQYRRKVRDLEEQAGRMERLEEELAKMRFLEGEAEHLKAVVHVLEMEKSAAEALVESLQARHSEQLKRLEDVHRNEVETLRKALLREEKRGAEEVKRLVEDHRKTLDRLMDANIKLEEEFRTRMLEARRDWGRDVEAMRVAYQQSNNAAITNASLAVLTGHSFGIETKDKSEDDIKDESSAKAVPQCPQEVKELSQTVERVESILTQALGVMLPKAKSQIEELPISETEVKDKGHSHVYGDMKKHQRKSLKSKVGRRLGKAQTHSKKAKDKVGKREKLCEQSGSSEEEEESVGEHSGGIYSSDDEQKFKDNLGNDTGGKVRRHAMPKGRAEQRKNVFCGDCKCCHGHAKDLQWHLRRSISAQDSHEKWDKYDKEGRNMDFRSRGGGQHWRNRKKLFAWKDQVDYGNIYLGNNEVRHIQHPEDSHFTMMEGVTLDRNVISTSRHSDAIIDPKAYLLQLASANINNLFQSSVVSSA